MEDSLEQFRSSSAQMSVNRSMRGRCLPKSILDNGKYLSNESQIIERESCTRVSFIISFARYVRFESIHVDIFRKNSLKMFVLQRFISQIGCDNLRNNV